MLHNSLFINLVIILKTIQTEGDKVEINLNGKPNGVYFVKLADAEAEERCIKLIKLD